ALVKATRPYFTPADVKEALQYLGTLDWKTTSDPDKTHEKLLDVSKLGPRGDFGVTVSGNPTVSTAGGEATFQVTLDRDQFSFERIGFRTTGLPRGVRASFAGKTLYGFGGRTTSMTIKVAGGLPAGTHHVADNGHGH